MKNYYAISMPAQRLPFSLKGDKWRQECVDAIIGMSGQITKNSRTSKQNKQINYDLYNSKFDESDFNYILDPLGVKESLGESPVKLQNYNVVRSKIELLKGEEIRRGFNFRAVGIYGNVVSEKQKKKRQAIIEMLQAMIAKEHGEQVDEEGELITPETVQKYIRTDLMDIREVTANQILDYLYREEKLEMKFNQGWEHSLIAGEEIYYVGIVNGEPRMRVVNPLNFDYDKDEDTPFIEDAQWGKEERYLGINTIIDLYGEYLSDTDFKKLEEGQVATGFNRGGMQLPGFAYDADVFASSNGARQAPIGSAYVANVCWKSMRKVGFLTYPNPKTGDPELTIVDESFRLTPVLIEQGFSLENRWIGETWEGTRIGDGEGAIYVNIRPLPNQQRSLTNPSECKLPYTGFIYNNVNSQATSLLDLIKPHQYTLITTWYRMEMEMSKANGRKFIFDIAMLPKSQGFDMNKWMYFFNNHGLAVINSLEEGRPGDPGSTTKFNQFSDVDLTLSQSIGQYMLIIEKLEAMIDTITGIPKSREGSIMASENVGNVERAQVQSSYITEPYFYYHNLVKQQVLTKLLETAKTAYKDGMTKHFIVDEVYNAMLKVDGDIFADSDYGVFVTNSNKDNYIKQKMEELAAIALQQDKANLSDMITILKTSSISQIESKIIESEQDRIEQTMQQEEANRQSAERLQSEYIAFEREKLDREDLNKQLDREASLREAELKALGMVGMSNPDMNGNGMPDVAEIAQISIKQAELAYKQRSESQKLLAQTESERRKAALEEKKLEKETEALKLDAAKFKREQDQQDDQHRDQLKENEKDRQLEKQRMAKEEQMMDKEFKLKQKEHSQKMALAKLQAKKQAAAKKSSANSKKKK